MSAELDEVDRNYEAFVSRLPDLLPRHRGQYALLHAQKVIDFFDSAASALSEGFRKFGEGRYSVQEVTAERDNLGFYSYAGGAGQA